MDTIIFSGIGCLLVLFAVVLIKKHKHFIAHSIVVDGEIINIVDRAHTTRGTLGGVKEQRILKVPVVRYRYNRFYQFESDTDISQEDLTVGSSVSVRINPLKPKSAKLDIGLKQSNLVFTVMIGLGLFFIIMGAMQFSSNDFDLSLFDDWFTLGFVLAGGIYLYIKLSPLLSFLKHSPIYTENAEEVEGD